jgi:sugar phosphate isomerase/epimerase
VKTSIATVSLSGTLGEKLDAIAAAKFDAVEIFENDLITFTGPLAGCVMLSKSRTGCRASMPIPS